MKSFIDTIQVGPNKLLVKMWIDKELVAKAKSLDALTLTADQKKDAMIKAVQDKIGSRSLVKAVILNCGPKLDPEMNYNPGEFVYVFPNTYSADFVLNDVGYYIYEERNILAKVDPEKGGEVADLTEQKEAKEEKPSSDSIILN